MSTIDVYKRQRRDFAQRPKVEKVVATSSTNKTVLYADKSLVHSKRLSSLSVLELPYLVFVMRSGSYLKPRFSELHWHSSPTRSKPLDSISFSCTGTPVTTVPTGRFSLKSLETIRLPNGITKHGLLLKPRIILDVYKRQLHNPRIRLLHNLAKQRLKWCFLRLFAGAGVR